MKSLILNTVMKKLAVVLDKDGEIFYEIVPAEKNHNEMVLSVVENILKKANVQLEDCDCFSCLIGPGSFTGIRVGIATQKAFASFFNKPVISVNTLEFLTKCVNTDGIFAMYGSRDSYFVAEVENKNFKLIKHNLTEKKLLNIDNNKTIFMFENGYFPDFSVKIVEPDYEILAKIVEEKYKNGEFSNLVPVYFQLSQAEEQKLITNLIIKTATKNDLSSLLKIDNLLFEDKWSKESILEEINNQNKKVFIAIFEDNIIGFIDYIEYPDENSIMKVAVLSEYQGKNVATRLIEYAFEQTKIQNKNIMSLEVNEKNIPAISLYKKLGFVLRRVRKNYYGQNQNAIEMFKNL